jgi:hypothetical protein
MRNCCRFQPVPISPIALERKIGVTLRCRCSERNIALVARFSVEMIADTIEEAGHWGQGSRCAL